MDSFLKADFLARAPKRHGQGLPRHAPGFPFYDMGARLRMSYKLARSAKKVNHRTGSMQPPCGYTPFHLCRSQWSRRRTAAQGACNRPADTSLPSSPNQWSRRQTAAQGACNRPAVVCPLSFAATSGPTSGMGAQAHKSYIRRAGSGVQESHTAARANIAPSRGRRRRLRR
jgi:hypothetical protein